MSTSNCAPCADCPPSPAPVMPRCNVVLPDGTYANATVVVEGGCITGVQAGVLPVYTPDECCPGGPGGGGTDGLDGPPGPPGQNATITTGTVGTVPFGTPAAVVNAGTPTNAILNFLIPQGAPGADAPGVSGVTNNSAGIQFVNGTLQSLPAQWPPIMGLLVNPVTTPGVTLTFVEDPSTALVTVTLDLSAFVTDLTTGFQTQIDALQSQIDTLETQRVAMQAQIDGILATCCGP